MWVMTRDSSHGQGMEGGSRRVATLDRPSNTGFFKRRDATRIVFTLFPVD